MMTGARQKNLARVRQRQHEAADKGYVYQLPVSKRPVVIAFNDDSTLIFALRIRNVLRAAAPNLVIQMAWLTEETALSYRQITQLLPDGPDLVLTGKCLGEAMMDPDIQAIVTSRVFRAMIGNLKNPAVRWASDRPCIISFLGGLDFFPHQGFMRRRNSDSVYLFPHDALAEYEHHNSDKTEGWQDVGFGHPSVMIPEGAPDDLASRSDIFFFPQALSPSTKRGRLHVLRMMIAVARANPNRRVYIKLRHLPDENREHLHKERYDYPGLMEGLGPMPDNLLLTDITMDQAMQTAALGITCTSTAALDLMSAGLPCMVYLDFVDAHRDRLVAPMRGLFKKSGVIATTEQVLNLEHGEPNAAWMKNMFCPRDLGTRVLDSIARFHARDFQI